MAKKKITGEDGKEYTIKEKKPFYKRWWFIALIVIIILGLIGSGGDEEDTAQEAEDAEATEQVSEDEESEETTEPSNAIVLGEPIELGDYTITVQDYSLGADYEGNDALIIEYDWANNSEDAVAPFMTFTFKGFQDNVETGDVFMVEGVDLETGQKEVRPEGQVEGAQTAVGIDDLSQPLELELTESFSIDNNSYTTEIDLSTIE